jgi:uncharacterized protein (DUF488 family)
MKNKLYTIGYSKYSLESFVNTLAKYGINAIADVRSTPFSRFKSEFNKDCFSEYLNKQGIKYVFLGKECGARFGDRNCYIDGKADYKLIAQHEVFQKGLKRIREGLKKFNVALMCAENDPIYCHRMILICRSLKQFNTPIYHIFNIDKIESQYKAEIRLLKLFNLDQLKLFDSKNDQLMRAYDKQGDKIAFKEDHTQTKKIPIEMV